MRYAHIVDNKIIEGPRLLPTSWINMSGFNLLPDDQLKTYGWLPWHLNQVELNLNEIHDNSIITIEQDRVLETQTKRQKTTEEISQEQSAKADTIRGERNQLLQDTDWIIIKSMETTVSDIDDWKAYRQQLRDITDQAGFPNDVNWPVKPE